MKAADLPEWTLSAHLDGQVMHFSLGDGHRLAWRSKGPAQLLALASAPLAAGALLGAELAHRLTLSPPRVLHVQYEPALDGIAWEQLEVGGLALAQHFALGRQVISAADSAPPPPAGLR